MKRKILVGLTLLMVAAAAPVTTNAQATAQTQQPASGTATAPVTQSLNPFQLANLAYEGGLEAQGIPSYGQFENAVSQHQIDAQDIVEAGAKAGYVPADTVNDGNYVNGVRTQIVLNYSDRDGNAR